MVRSWATRFDFHALVYLALGLLVSARRKSESTESAGEAQLSNAASGFPVKPALKVAGLLAAGGSVGQHMFGKTQNDVLPDVPTDWRLDLRSAKPLSDGRKSSTLYKVGFLDGHDRQVAVKRLQIIEDEDLDHVKREIALTKEYSSLPGFITYYGDSGTSGKAAGDSVYMMVELASGNLRSEVISKSMKQVPMTTRLRLFIDITRAVRDMSENGLVHRNLKPENVLIIVNNSALDSRRAVICGFASACHVRGGTMACPLFAELLGTPAYMSPDSFNYEGTARDVWSLGVILYELFLGGVPQRLRKVRYLGDAEDVFRSGWDIDKDPGFITLKDTAPKVAALLKRMLDKNPDTRISAADAVTVAEDIAKEWSLEVRADYHEEPQEVRKPRVGFFSRAIARFRRRRQENLDRQSEELALRNMKIL